MTDPLIVPVAPRQVTDGAVTALRMILSRFPGSTPVVIVLSPKTSVSLGVTVDGDDPDLLAALLAWREG